MPPMPEDRLKRLLPLPERHHVERQIAEGERRAAARAIRVTRIERAVPSSESGYAQTRAEREAPVLAVESLRSR